MEPKERDYPNQPNSDGLGTWNLGFGVWKWDGEMSWTRHFFIFCHIFGIFDDFSKWSELKVLRNFEKTSNMPKICTYVQKMKNSLVQFGLNPFLANTGYLIIRFWVPSPSLQPCNQQTNNQYWVWWATTICYYYVSITMTHIFYSY